MSFGGQNTSAAFQMKKFETQSDIEERKKLRQEQWEEVRKPEDPVERPEEDNRSLFDKLQDQKDKKQQDYEDQFKFANAVKGLGEDEANFLDEVSRRQMEIEKQRHNEEASIIKELRDANVTKVQEPKASTDKAPAKSKPNTSVSTKKSQQSLLLGAVKRKSTDSSVSENKEKSDASNRAGPSIAAHPIPGSNGYSEVIGILPGIGNYSDDSTDSNSSNSDLELEDLMNQPKIRRIIVRTSENC